jgi:hypothetical protein
MTSWETRILNKVSKKVIKGEKVGQGKKIDKFI